MPKCQGEWHLLARLCWAGSPRRRPQGVPRAGGPCESERCDRGAAAGRPMAEGSKHRREENVRYSAALFELVPRVSRELEQLRCTACVGWLYFVQVWTKTIAPLSTRKRLHSHAPFATMLLGTKDGSPSATAQWLDLPKLWRQGQEAFAATTTAQQPEPPKLTCWRQGQEASAGAATA